MDAEQIRKKADHYNKYLKDWEEEGTAYKGLLKAIEKAADKGQYSLDYQINEKGVPDSVFNRLRENGFDCDYHRQDEERLRSMDPDTYDTVPCYYLRVSWRVKK